MNVMERCFNVVYLRPRRGVAGGTDSMLCSSSFPIAASCTLFSLASVSSSSASASMPITDSDLVFCKL